MLALRHCHQAAVGSSCLPAGLTTTKNRPSFELQIAQTLLMYKYLLRMRRHPARKCGNGGLHRHRAQMLPNRPCTKLGQKSSTRSFATATGATHRGRSKRARRGMPGVILARVTAPSTLGEGDLRARFVPPAGWLTPTYTG